MAVDVERAYVDVVVASDAMANVLSREHVQKAYVDVVIGPAPVTPPPPPPPPPSSRRRNVAMMFT